MSSSNGKSEGGASRYGKSVSTNTKVFRDLTTKLSSNVEEDYIEAAKKLTKWLGCEKAYYQEARPQIVTMLETASYTLARLLGLRLANDLHISRCTPELQPRTAAYIALVQTVKPYLSIFPEDHLKTRLVNIFSTIYVSPQESQPTLGTSAVLMRRSAADGGSAMTSSLGVSSTTISPVTPTSRGSVFTSSTRPEGFISQNTRMDERRDKSATPRGSHRPSQISFSKDSFTASKSNSPTASQPDSAATSQSVGMRASGSPHSGRMPINQPFHLQEAVSGGSVSGSDDVQSTISSVETQSVRSAEPLVPLARSLSTYSFSASTPTANSHMSSALTQPIGHAPAQQSVSPPVDIISISSTTPSSSSKLPHVKRPPFSSVKFELLAALDKKSWKKAARPGSASQEQEKTMKKEDNSGENGKFAQHSVSVSSLVERNSPGFSSYVAREQIKASPSGGTTPQMTTMPLITSMSSSGDIPPNDQVSLAGSGVAEQVAVQASALTQQMDPHPRENIRSESAGNGAEANIPTSELPAESSPTPPSHAPNPEVPTPDEDLGQQKEAASLHIELPGADEMDISSVDGIVRQHDFPSPPKPSKMDVSLEPVTQEGAEDASNLIVQEVERFSNPVVELQHPGFVSPTPSVAGTPAVNTQRVSHVNGTTPLQPSSNGESVSYGEGVKGWAITTPPSEPMPLPNGAAVVDVAATRPSLRQASPIDQASTPQNDDTPAMAGAASSNPATGVGTTMSDTKKEIMAVVAKHILKEYGNEETRDRVDGMVKHLSFRLDDVFASGPDAKKLHAMLEARKQSLSGGQGMFENAEESSMTQIEYEGVSAPSGENPVHRSSGGFISSGTKRARSPSVENPVSERPSNRPRKEAGTNAGEKSSGDVAGTSHQVRGESLDDLQEDVASASASGGLWSSAAKESAGENGIARNKELDQTESASTGKGLAEGVSESQSLPQDGSLKGYTSQMAGSALPPLKPQTYHPSQPYEIISVVEGSPMGVIQDIRFQLDDEQATLVKRWANRYDTFDQTTPCISFTLICTRLPDGQTSGQDERDIDETTQNMAIQWPSSGGFWITVEADDRPPVSIPLSPPYWIEGYEPLDLSDVVGKGITKIRFTQTKDHSQYLFILRAHRPTEAQLHELDSMSLTGHMWTETLARVAAPLPADLKSGILSRLTRVD